MGCLQSKEKEKTERLYLAKDHTEIDALKRKVTDKELNVSTPSITEQKDSSEIEESDTEVIFSDTEDDVVDFNMKNLNKIRAKIEIKEDSTAEEFERKIYRYFTRHPYFGKFPTLERLREAQKWYRSANITPPNDRLNIPVPHPTMTTKTQFLELKEFYAIDEHAINTPDVFLKEDMGKLTEYLVEPATDELEQVRVIFRWITSHTIFPKDSKRKSYPPHSVGAFLMDVKQRQLSRDQLFCNMCEYTGVKTALIKGMVKGVNFHAFDRKAGRSSWSAVLVNKSWRLLDVGWASSYLTGIRDAVEEQWASPSSSQNTQKKRYNFRDFYFFCDPEEFIYTHFPDERKWQLLARTLTEKEWFQLVEIKDSFFKLGLKLGREHKCIEECSEGVSSVQIHYPKDSVCKFTYQFLIAQSDTKDYAISPDGYVFMENLSSKHVLNLSLKLPFKGRYKLSIFGGDVMYQICTFYFMSPIGNEEIAPLPKNECKDWGAGSNMEGHGISPLTHEGGIIYALDGEAEMRLKSDHDLEFSHKLAECGEEDIGLDNCVLHRIENNEVIFNIRVPDNIVYSLSIYCRQANSNQHTRFRHVANYLVKVQGNVLPLYQFPPVPDGRLGPSKDFFSLGLKQLDKNPCYMCFPEKGEVEFLFKYPGDMSFQAQLILAGKSIQSLPNYLMMEMDNNVLSCRVRASTHGLYSLTILGNSLSTDNTKSLYTALLECFIPCKKYSPFPTKCSSQLLCKLNKPLSSYIIENTKISVELVSLDAQEIAAVGSYEEWTHSFEEWTHFVGKSKGIWQGTVVAPESDFELEIVGSTDKGSNKFTTLFKYLAISKDYHAKKENEQKGRIKSAKETVAKLVKAGKIQYNDVTGEVYRTYEPGDLMENDMLKKSNAKEDDLRVNRKEWLRLAVFSASRRKLTKAIQEYKKCYPRDKPEELLLAESILVNLNSGTST